MKILSLRFILPLFLFLALGGLLWKGLSLNPNELPSALIGKPSPQFNLITVENPNQTITEKIFKGKMSVLNVWATWCVSCKAEHAVWMELIQKHPLPSDLLMIGLNYHDVLTDAQHWLKIAGNPYQATIFDEAGRLGIDFGVYGTPETFILDQEGVIRYRHVGPVDLEVWENKLLPMIESLKK